MDVRPIPRSHPLRSLLPALLIGATGTACTQYVEVIRDRGPQAHYQTAFPLQDASGPLTEGFRSVKRVQASAVYLTYLFGEEAAPSEVGLDLTRDLALAVDTVSTLRERAATAVVISGTEDRRLLVTVDHVIHFPDTVVTYFEEEEGAPPPPPAGAPPRRVASVSIRTVQTNWVLDPPFLESFEVLARDASADLALLSVRLPSGDGVDPAPPLRLAAGDPTRLSWGSFVYVLGYPRGYPMVTRGIVSVPEELTAGSFLVDGLWNPGMSGGPILAVRGDGGGLEWVGIARAASGALEARVVPEPRALERNDLRLPYEGPLFLEEFRRVEYGITHAVPMTEIRAFLEAHRAELSRRGYTLPRL